RADRLVIEAVRCLLLFVIAGFSRCDNLHIEAVQHHNVGGGGGGADELVHIDGGVAVQGLAQGQAGEVNGTAAENGLVPGNDPAARPPDNLNGRVTAAGPAKQHHFTVTVLIDVHEVEPVAGAAEQIGQRPLFIGVDLDVQF